MVVVVFMAGGVGICGTRQLLVLAGILPGNMNEIKEKMANLPATVMTSVGEATEKCVLQ